MTPDLTHAAWRKSTRSANEGANCVEIARVSNVVAVRDSKNPAAGNLVLAPAVFGAFIDAVKGDRFVA